MRLTKQQFIDRFTPSEMQGILAAARQSVAVEAWLFRFQSLTPDVDGTSIDTNDPRTVAGVLALEQAGLLPAGRATEILGDGALQSHSGFAIGQVVQVKPPFDEFGQQTITRIEQQIDGQVVFILGDAGGFAAEYLEATE